MNSEEVVCIRIDEHEIKVAPFDTPTARAIINACPFEAQANTWGDEIYFDTPVSETADETAKDVLDLGEIAFWVAGNCIAIGFGPTPVSIGDEIRLASDANIWGRSKDDLKILKTVKNGAAIHVSLKPKP